MNYYLFIHIHAKQWSLIYDEKASIYPNSFKSESRSSQMKWYID
jgi:hypothetical protein